MSGAGADTGSWQQTQDPSDPNPISWYEFISGVGSVGKQTSRHTDVDPLNVQPNNPYPW